MSLAALFLALLTIALSAYFLPRNFAPRTKVGEGAEAKTLESKEGNGGEDIEKRIPKERAEAKTSEPKQGNGGEDIEKKIPISVNYHLTRQCNYSCGLSPLPLIQHFLLIVRLTHHPHL